jgi:hypothetical protein
MEATMKNAVFWDVTPHGCCKNRRFGGTYRLHHQDDMNRQDVTTLAVTSYRSTLIETANDVPSSLILVTLMMETLFGNVGTY